MCRTNISCDIIAANSAGRCFLNLKRPPFQILLGRLKAKTKLNVKFSKDLVEVPLWIYAASAHSWLCLASSSRLSSLYVTHSLSASCHMPHAACCLLDCHISHGRRLSTESDRHVVQRTNYISISVFLATCHIPTYTPTPQAESWLPH